MHNFKELQVWKKARVFVSDIYLISKNFPPSELYGLTSQLRRAAISISSNIAEGSGRRTNKDFIHFLDTAFSSALEVESLLFLCCDLQLIDSETLTHCILQITEIQKMIRGLSNNLEN